MFPYNEKPISKLRTSSDIERFGYQALLRALNIGRVVAFVGSGTSQKFGQPSWSALADEGYKLFFALENAILALDVWDGDDSNELVKDFREALSPLVREIKDLRKNEGFETPHKVELIEDYFAVVETILDRHTIKAHSLREKSPLKNFTDAIKQKENELGTDSSSISDKDYYFGPKPSDKDESDDLASNVAEFRRTFAAIFKSVERDEESKPDFLKLGETFAEVTKGLGLDGSSAIEQLDGRRSEVTEIDGARTLRRRLGIRRFLTLNYDLELELMLFEEGRATPLTAYQDFNEFLIQNSGSDAKDMPYEPGRAVSLRSPSGRVIRSTSSRSDTLADLFSFGAFPTNYDATVHHLHGRLDDPENMIVTPKDYQRIYYGASDQKKSFDEARHAVFTGSDILVLGLGSTENDVLKPLRDFLELEEDRRDAHGKVYYVTSAEISGKEDSFAKAFDTARLDAMAKTQSLYKDYGMHTLFADFSFDDKRTRAWTSDSANCFAVRAEIAHYLHRIGSKDKIEPWSTPTVEEEFKEKLGEVWRCSGNPSNLKKCEAKPLEYSGGPEIELARKIANEWNAQRAAVSKEKQAAFKKALRMLDSHLRDISLVEYAKHLEQSRKSWWEDWSQFPGMRVAALGPHRYKLKEQPDPEHVSDEQIFEVDENLDGTASPMVWKQTNLVAHFRDDPLKLGNPDSTPQFSGVLAATGAARKAAKTRAKLLQEEVASGETASPINRSKQRGHFPQDFPASVARLSIPPGGGKGRLLAYFTCKQRLTGEGPEVWPFQTLFNPIHASGENEQGPEFWPFKGLFGSIDVSGKEDDAKPYEGYKFCFMSHLTFALEFSGTMIAFARILQQMLPQLRNELEEDSEEAKDDRWRRLMKHQFQQRTGAVLVLKTISDMFELLQDSCPRGGWKTRMVAIFSYLDRLVDEKGDAYSPIHREFFRLISGWKNEDEHLRLPVDIVLINCFANQPIRYLSEEETLLENQSGRRDEPWRDGNWKLRHDRKLALKHWTELKRVRPRIIFLEALENFAGMVPANNKTSALQKDAARTLARVLKIEFRQDPKSNLDDDFLSLPPNLKKFMYRRVAHGYFIAGLASAIWNITNKDSEAFQTEWDRCVSALDIAYAREKSRGLVEELLGIYRRLDRTADIASTGRVDGLSRLRNTEESRVLERLRTMMIDHLALLQVPITAETLMACPDVNRVAKEAAELDKKKRNVIAIMTYELNLLVARGLATRYEKFADKVAGLKENVSFVYVLNSRVAGVLRARSNLEVYSQYKLMVFQPNAYPSQPERALKPDISHFERVGGVVRALVKETHNSLVELYWDMRFGKTDYTSSDNEFAKEMEAHNDRLRAAYALIRGTFSISVIARLAERADIGKRTVPFDEYRVWTRKLLNTATLLHKIRNIDMVHRIEAAHRKGETADALPYNHPFLRDELSWLYNERALVSFVQGRLFDALPLFEQAQIMLGTSTDRSAPTSHGATHRRVQMNYALAQVERGNIVIAQDILARIVTETEERWQSDTPSVVHCMAKGYLALCHHLTNEFPRAQAGYIEVLETIGQFNHPRAESIFRRHYSDLLRTMSTSRNDPEYKEAISILRSSEELALGIRATDLQHYALVAQARLDRDMHERGQALENLRKVEEYARAMGIQKMLCEVLKVRGEVLLAEGETTQAGFVTSQSIAISKRNGMRLRKISATIIQAQILRERQQIKDANRLLEETITESQALGYATKTSQAMHLFRG